MNYLLLDTSYIIFYRYFALLQWWKLAKKDIELPENPYECEEFVEKFKKLFLEQINTIKKKLKIHKEECKVIAATEIVLAKKFGEMKFIQNIKKQDTKMMLLWEESSLN